MIKRRMICCEFLHIMGEFVTSSLAYQMILKEYTLLSLENYQVMSVIELWVHFHKYGFPLKSSKWKKLWPLKTYFQHYNAHFNWNSFYSYFMSFSGWKLSLWFPTIFLAIILSLDIQTKNASSLLIFMFQDFKINGINKI